MTKKIEELRKQAEDKKSKMKHYKDSKTKALAHYKIAELYFEVGGITKDPVDYKEAEKNYLAAIKLNQDSQLYVIKISQLYALIHRTDDAVKYMKLASTLTPSENYLEESSVLDTMQEIAKLENVKARIIEINDPTLREILNTYGDVLVRHSIMLGSHDKRIETLERLLLKSLNREEITEEEIKELNKGLSDANKKIEIIDGKIVLIEERITSLEKQLGSCKDEINSILKEIQNVCTKQEDDEKQIENIQKNIDTLEEALLQKIHEAFEILSRHDEILIDSGTNDLVNIRQEFMRLKKDEPELYEYSKAFYWSLLEYLKAYEVLHSGIVQGVYITIKDKGAMFVIEKGAKYAADAAKGIPFVGGALAVIDSLVSDIYTGAKALDFTRKVNAINQVITNEVHDNLSSIVANIALTLVSTESKKQQVLTEQNLIDEPTGIQDKAKSKLIKLSKWFKNQVGKVKEKVLFEEFKSSNGAQLALEDVAKLLAYIYKDFEDINQTINKLYGKPLQEILASIVINNNLEGLDATPPVPTPIVVADDAVQKLEIKHEVLPNLHVVDLGGRVEHNDN